MIKSYNAGHIIKLPDPTITLNSFYVKYRSRLKYYKITPTTVLVSGQQGETWTGFYICSNAECRIRIHFTCSNLALGLVGLGQFLYICSNAECRNRIHFTCSNAALGLALDMLLGPYYTCLAWSSGRVCSTHV